MARKKIPKKFPYRRVARILILLGTLLVTISTAHQLLRLRSLSLDRRTVQAHITGNPAGSTNQESQVLPERIYIEWFVDIGIEPAIYSDQRWTVSPNFASYLLASARPGEAGNIVIYGHNTRGILGNIRALKGGERVRITMSDGTVRSYRVESAQEVSPKDTALIQPTEYEVLTMYTCSGLMDSQRYVVQAFPENN
jgi:LPXTG-site transpeptidase (sortase) family protein